MNDSIVNLYLVRHGETESNRLGVLHGSTDTPLNQSGVIQAKLLAERMVTEMSFTAIYASPLRRARSTAQAVAAESGHQVRLLPKLVEMNFGEAEGASIDDIYRTYARENSQFLDPANLDVRFPGGESRREFYNRIASAFDDLEAKHPGDSIVVVAHGGVVAAALRLFHQDPDLGGAHSHIENCSITHVELGNSTPVIHRYNDTRHLNGFESFTHGGESAE